MTTQNNFDLDWSLPHKKMFTKVTLTAKFLPRLLVHFPLLLKPGMIDGKLFAHELSDALSEHVLLWTEM